MKSYLLKISRFAAILLLLLFFSMAENATAQMFSVQEDNAAPTRPMASNGFYIGYEPAEFTYQGDPNTQGGGDFAFEGPLLRARYETPGFEAYLGVGGNITGIDRIGYFDAGAKAGTGFRILGNRQFRLYLPIQLKSTVNTVSNNEVLTGTSEFRQGTFELGAGGQLSFRFGEGVRLSLSAIPNYGFSFATGGIFGGNIFDLETGGRLYVDRLFGSIGLTAGADYNFKRFDVDEDEYDYNFQSFSILVGITF